MTRLSHFDENGSAVMVDVGDKTVTRREAIATGTVVMKPETVELIQSGSVRKGDVLGVARLAGIMAAKRTDELVPLCHSLPLSAVSLAFACDAKRGAVAITATCRTEAQTGVEMEALTAVSVAALTIYDMCKAADRDMRVTDIRLLGKTGGRSDRLETALAPGTAEAADPGTRGGTCHEQAEGAPNEA